MRKWIAIHNTMESISRQARMTVKHPQLLQFYSARTANGMKVAMMLEELIIVRAGKEDFNYEPHTVDIRHAESRKKHFLAEINPNGKIPAIHDPHGPNGLPVTVWESGAILLYLGEKYRALMPLDNPVERVETMKWLFWGSTGLSTQAKSLGFYFKFCSHEIPYCIARASKECNRLLGVLEAQMRKHGKPYVVGDEYTIADVAIWPWVHALIDTYDNAVEVFFDNLKEYPQVREWYQRILDRPATQRAMLVTPYVF